MKKKIFLIACFAIIGLLTFGVGTIFASVAGASLCVLPAAGVVHVSTDMHRAIFDKIKEKHKDHSVVPGFLRLEQKIQNGQQVYTFPLTVDTSATITEVRLNRNDKFHVVHVGLFLMARLSTKIGVEVLQTYPNQDVFANYSSTFIGTDLEAFYNGYISYRIGQVVEIDKLDTRQFRVVSYQQQQAANNHILNSSSNDKDGYCMITPQITLDGDKNTAITLSAPIPSSALVANTNANTDNYLVMMMKGFLITDLNGNK